MIMATQGTQANNRQAATIIGHTMEKKQGSFGAPVAHHCPSRGKKDPCTWMERQVALLVRQAPILVDRVSMTLTCEINARDRRSASLEKPPIWACQDSESMPGRPQACPRPAPGLVPLIAGSGLAVPGRWYAPVAPDGRRTYHRGRVSTSV